MDGVVGFSGGGSLGAFLDFQVGSLGFVFSNHFCATLGNPFFLWEVSLWEALFVVSQRWSPFPTALEGMDPCAKEEGQEEAEAKTGWPIWGEKNKWMEWVHLVEMFGLDWSGDLNGSFWSQMGKVPPRLIRGVGALQKWSDFPVNSRTSP